MDLELKIAIIEWLCENKNRWQRTSECASNFRDYIYNKEGNFLIGGSKVYDFIIKADRLLFAEESTVF